MEYAPVPSDRYFPEPDAAADDLMDFVRNVAGFDDGLLTTPDLNVLRTTLREWRAEARAILDAQ